MLHHFRHADILLHQRLSFWMVAETALIAGLSQVIENRPACALIALFGILFTVLARHVMGTNREFGEFIRAVPNGILTGSRIMNVWLPLVFALFWTIVLSGTLVDAWGRK
jgi:hypothetical protein